MRLQNSECHILEGRLAWRLLPFRPCLISVGTFQRPLGLQLLARHSGLVPVEILGAHLLLILPLHLPVCSPFLLLPPFIIIIAILLFFLLRSVGAGWRSIMLHPVRAPRFLLFRRRRRQRSVGAVGLWFRHLLRRRDALRNGTLSRIC